MSAGDGSGTFLLEPAAGERLVGDHVSGSEPGYVFLHGLASVRVGVKSEALREWAQERGKAFARFDFRGHGDSSGMLGEVTLSDKIEDARAVLEHVGPSVLVGSSMGGLIATWCAARHPGLVRALVLLAPAFGFLRRIAGHVEGGSFVVASQEHDLPIHRRVLEDAAGYDEVELPRRLDLPVLVVHGALDDTVPPEVSRTFCAALPPARTRLRVLPEGDHSLSNTMDEILAEMAAFLRAHGADS